MDHVQVREVELARNSRGGQPNAARMNQFGCLWIGEQPREQLGSNRALLAPALSLCGINSRVGAARSMRDSASVRAPNRACAIAASNSAGALSAKA
jgi:hypothetical protein